MLKNLIEISNFYGNNPDYVIAGGGNTSFKTEKEIYIKASGCNLSGIDEKGFVGLERSRVRSILSQTFSSDPILRETEIKDALLAARISGQDGRPSVETSLHELFSARFVVHTHPYTANALLCSQNAEKYCREIFGAEAVYIPYTDPGFLLAKKFQEEMTGYRKKYGQEPEIILLQNHGVFAGADSIEKIKEIYLRISEKISVFFKETISSDKKNFPAMACEIMPAIRMLMSNGPCVPVLVFRSSPLIDFFVKNSQEAGRVQFPFTPDIIVYCKTSPLFIDSSDPSSFPDVFKKELERYRKLSGYDPKIILIKGCGLIACEENKKSADTAAEVFIDAMKISYYSRFFGGPSFLRKKDIDFIDSWEVENYRRKISRGSSCGQKLSGKTAIVTGAAQGFGRGIADELFTTGANVVIADLNMESAEKTAGEINSSRFPQRAVAVRTDVTDPASVQNLIS
ncbi:MAG TPA: hypothetical protein DC049_15295, partial [Spirochaetia bacterium]|nr:hypothetical protein [Spirochaetia bacterium]